MKMLQAYEGYLEEGQVYTVMPLVRVKNRRRVIITVLDEPAQDSETVQRVAALDKFFAEIEASDEDVPVFERVKLREVEV